MRTRRRLVAAVVAVAPISAFGPLVVPAPAEAAVVAPAFAWGRNADGQLGDGTTTRRLDPVPVSSLANLTTVVAGFYHSVALKSDGTVWAWGDNAYGQLGNGTVSDSSTPRQVLSLTGVTAVAAGGYHSLALRSDGTVWAWGYNDWGQLGNGTVSSVATPVQVSQLSGVIAVAAGGFHSLAVKSDGTVRAWGANMFGQLGDGTTLDSAVPRQVLPLTDVTAVAAGAYHSVARRASGQAAAWGYNVDGQLGNGTTTDSFTPVQVANLNDATALAANANYTVALRSGGTVSAWGENRFGQLGDGTTTSRTTPGQVSRSEGVPLAGVTAVAAGYFHGMALTSDGTPWAWGNNIDGQLGNGTTTDFLRPVPLSALTGVSAVAAGAYHSLAIKAQIDGDPSATVSPVQLEFGNQGVGATSPAQSVVVTNTGGGSLQVASVTVLGQNAGDFAIASNGCTGPLLGGGRCSIDVTFRPTGTSARAASVQIVHNAPGSPNTVALSGTGVGPGIGISPAQLDFGNQGVGTTSAPRSVVVTNTGGSPLEVASVAIDGTNPGDFAISSDSCPGSVAPGGSCTVGVTFMPTAPFARAASLRIVDNAAGSPHAVALSGVGLRADLAISATVRSRNIRMGEELSYTITVSNLGPTSATGVTVTDVLPPNTKFVTATPSAGTCTTPLVGGNGTVVCTFGTVPNGSGNSRTVTVRVQSPPKTTVTNTATVSSTSSDPNPANNSVTIVERVH